MVFLNITYLVIGFFLLIKGADKMIDGSASVAKKFGLSGLMIGLTVIAFGTSAPELIVNVLASINGNSDIGMGNIIGSNISNILLILGVSALFASIRVDNSIVKKQLPFSILAIVALFVLINSTLINGSGLNGLSRSGGIILMLFFCIFLYYTFSITKSKEDEEDGDKNIKIYKNWLSFIFIIGGIIALFVGGKLIVEGATFLALSLGLSEALIGLTIVAIGTSLPELAASISAARKNQMDMAVGNVIGSNIFNILFVLSLSAVIRPIEFNPLMNFDILFLIYISILLFLLIFMGRKYYFEKKEGFVLLGVYFIYLVFIIFRG